MTNLLLLYKVSIIEQLEPVFIYVLPSLMTLVCVLAVFWCVLLGIKSKKAVGTQARAKARHDFKNALIGHIVIIVVLIALEVTIAIIRS